MNFPVPTENALTRLRERELRWCLRLNRSTQWRAIEFLFAKVSRLGDGMFWYTFMACLIAYYGSAAIESVGRMLCGGVIGLLIYRWLKSKTSRPRPCTNHTEFRVSVAPLDEFSFPSGHTLHAVSFTLVALYYYPHLFWLLVPFAGLIALSRLILGLHYPSDVLVGGLIGCCVALTVLQF